MVHGEESMLCGSGSARNRCQASITFRSTDFQCPAGDANGTFFSPVSSNAISNTQGAVRAQTKRAEGLRVGAIPFLQRFAVCRNSVHVKMLPTRACGRADDAYV